MGLWFALLTACGPAAPVAELYAVEPDRGWKGESTDVRIEGHNLLPTLDLGAEDQVAGDFEAWLELPEGDVRLEGVQLVDFSTVSAQVPAGIDPGLYPLGLRTPAGSEARLEDAFRVTRTRADRLTVTIESGVAAIGDYATMTVRVEDPLGDVIPSELDVAIEAHSALSARGVVFGPNQIGSQADLVDRVGITGRLDADGSTDVKVTSTEADDVTFTVSAVGDDELVDGSTLITWQSGAATGAVIDLPFSPFRAVAGEPFTVHVSLQDAAGHPLPDAYARILLSDECSNYHPKVDVFGEADVEVTLSAACPVDHLTVSSDSVAEAVSEAFEVVAAPQDGYRVTATPGSAVTAGVDPVLVQVEAVDPFGNVVPDGGGTLTLSDDLVGIDEARTSCQPFDAGVALCLTYLRRAGADVIHVVDEAAFEGESGTVFVEADVPTALAIDLAVREAIAGNEVVTSVGVTDTFGNLVEFEPAGADPIDFEDDAGSVTCVWTGAIGDGHQAFRCTFTTAWEDDEVRATLVRSGLTGVASDTITIHNAELADVEVTVPTSVVAGTTFPLSVEGYDRFGNPYIRQTDPVVDLDDTTGALSVSSATLGASGSVTTAAMLTQATTGAFVYARQYGTLLGTSGSIAVTAAGMDGFDVVAPAWVGIGADADIVVRAVDAYDNPILGYAGSASLSVTDDACDPAMVEGFVAGAVAVSVPCTTPRIGARVQVTEGSYTGQSSLMEVVDFDCATPPTAALTIDAEAEPRLCLAAGEVTAAVDATGSTAGGAALSMWHFRDDSEVRVRSAAGTGSYTWEGAGPRRVEALVVDADGCADTATTWAWVGEDDGEPTGPVDVSPGTSSVVTGGSVGVDLLAYDCRGDVAAGQDLYVRATLGELSGTATGSGLTVTLDGAGEGSLTWSFPGGYADVATLYAGSESAGGYGAANVAVTQDSARPHVVAVTPTGAVAGTIDEVVVQFDEPLLSASTSAATLTGPSGAVAVTVTLDQDVLTVTPDSPLDASGGTYTLTLSSVVRDEAGNRLDGAWSGAAGSFTSHFGDVGESLPTLAGCAVGTDTFRPDGDVGLGEEADSVTFTPVSSSSPTWWAIDVEDAAGERIRTTRVAGSAGTVSWDGVADDGLVVDGGTYTVTVWAIDAVDNYGEVCVESIDVDHRLELP